MIKAVKYSPEYRDVWDNFVNNSRTPMFMFNRGYMEYHADRFTDASLLFFDDDELVAVMPASIKNDTVSSHGGLTFGGIISNIKMHQHTMLDIFDAMMGYYRDIGAKRVIYKSIPYIYQEYPAQEDLYALFRNNAKILKIDPSCTVDLTQKIKMPKGRHAQVMRAKREGVEIVESTDFHKFIELENAVLGQYHNASAVHSGDEMTLLASRFPDNIKLWFAEYKGEKIACGVLFVYKDVVHTQYLAADDTARVIGALDLMIYTIMEQYRGQKRWFDMGCSTLDEARFLNEGLIAQKEGFGGRVVANETWEITL
ncbi:MAG: GNAT family N-acetyltransferase [Alphaproteobacteria bacterium]|nr:GNAT family N-acetyltransferase [Alphaproteobacteria bacterium]